MEREVKELKQELELERSAKQERKLFEMEAHEGMNGDETDAGRVAKLKKPKKLEIAVKEAREAKAGESKVLDQIKDLSLRNDAASVSISESGGNIMLSREDFESWSRKVEESNMLAEMRVGALMAQVDAVKASENEAVKRLEMAYKEIEEMKVATKEAGKKVEMAEAAKKAVEEELRRWRERDQKKAALRILDEREVVPESSPRQHRVEEQFVFPEKDAVVKKVGED